MVLLFLKNVILKKKYCHTILKLNKKKVTLFVSKQVKYIYTEADLDQGKLDEGYIYPGQTFKRTQITNYRFGCE